MQRLCLRSLRQCSLIMLCLFYTHHQDGICQCYWSTFFQIGTTQVVVNVLQRILVSFLPVNTFARAVIAPDEAACPSFAFPGAVSYFLTTLVARSHQPFSVASFGTRAKKFRLSDAEKCSDDLYIFPIPVFITSASAVIAPYEAAIPSGWTTRTASDTNTTLLVV